MKKNKKTAKIVKNSKKNVKNVKKVKIAKTNKNNNKTIKNTKKNVKNIKKSPKKPKIVNKTKSKKIVKINKLAKNTKKSKKIVKIAKKTPKIAKKTQKNSQSPRLKLVRKFDLKSKKVVKEKKSISKTNSSRISERNAKKPIKSNEKRKNNDFVKTEKSPRVEKDLTDNRNVKKNIIDITTKINENKNLFKIGEYAVYPSHGIGKIIDIETAVIAGQDFSCYLMYFEKEKLTIKVPVKNSNKIGLRPLVSKTQMEEVLSILRSGNKKMKGMWSRRAQEYESKINSGDIMALAEVLRDLTRDIEDGDRSYSERIIYETAIARLTTEYSYIYSVEFEYAKSKIVSLSKDKVSSEAKEIRPKDDDFDFEEKDEEEDEESEDEDEESEDDEDYEDDEQPKKHRK